MPLHRTCLRCESAFTAAPSTVAAGNGKYCSRACAWGPRERRTCVRCDAVFTVPPSVAAAGQAKYCSRACYLGTLDERFWRRVDRLPSGCWRWTGPVIARHSEYGVCNWAGQSTLAHRVSWMLHHGPIPDGLLVRHRCPGGGNPWCVNPEHLALGDYEDNSRDMLEDGNHWSQTGRWTPPKGIRKNPPHCPTCRCSPHLHD